MQGGCDGNPGADKSAAQYVDEDSGDNSEKTHSNENLDSHVLSTPLSLKSRDSK